jgi:hypothetical protein
VRNKISSNRQFVLVLTAILMTAASIAAQTTAFTFQGRLNTSGSPATGAYEMQFQIFDSVKGGVQIGQTFTDTNVAVVNGVFTTTLDFSAAAFDGSARFVEIGVRPAGNTGPFTILAPRQTIKSAPYSIQSKNAAAADALSANCVNCVTSGQIESIDGGQITGVLPTKSIPTGSDNYIQNSAVARGDSVQQTASLNIGGNATVGSFGLNGAASLAGSAAPAVAPTGQGRIYFDDKSNKVKVSENGGPFIDLVGAGGVAGSGTTNSIALWSSGTTLGISQITQNANGVQLPNAVQMAVGAQGYQVSLGSPNGETGMTIAGPAASSRADLRFDGINNKLRLFAGPAGGPPSSGISMDTSGNVGIRTATPLSVLDIGATGDGAELLRFSTERPWIFKQIRTGPSAGLQLFSTSGAKKFEITTNDGFNVATFLADSNISRVGIGTTNPSSTLDVAGNVSASGSLAIGNGATITGDVTVSNKITSSSMRVNGSFSFTTVAGTYSQDICRDTTFGTLGQCGTSLRQYKSNIKTFAGGLNIVNRLHPVTFTWKESGQQDVGFIAEEVEQTDPLLTTRSETGELLGVKYRQLGVIFVNAFKEQQKEIEQQRQQIERQQRQIEALMQLVCAANGQAEICKQK